MWHFRFFLIAPLFVLSLILGQEKDFIIFPHQLHLDDLELECDLCHEDVAESISLTTRLLPEKDICSDCHDDDTATDECSACHKNEEDPQPYRERPFRPGPIFSHSFHLEKRPNCTDCHEYIYTDEGDSPSKVWMEGNCQDCHQSIRPEHHTLNWVSIHGTQVNQTTLQNCNLCHRSTSCDACHQLQQFEPKVHPVAYLLSHGFDARMGVLDCSSCHDVLYDCQNCHRQNSVMPMDHNLLNWVGSEFMLENGGMHSSAALDAPEICQACHNPASENTCLRCHGE